MPVGYVGEGNISLICFCVKIVLIDTLCQPPVHSVQVNSMNIIHVIPDHSCHSCESRNPERQKLDPGFRRGDMMESREFRKGDANDVLS